MLELPTKAARRLFDFLVGRIIQVNVNGSLSNQINPKVRVHRILSWVHYSFWFTLMTFQHRTTNKTSYPSSFRLWYCTMGFQFKRTFSSKTFATGPSKLGCPYSMVCQMDSQTESRKNQGDHILQVRSRQKNRTQPKTVWRDIKSLSSSEISRNYFLLSTHFPKTLWAHPGSVQYQVPRIKITSQSELGT